MIEEPGMTAPWQVLAFLALLAFLFTGFAAYRLLRERALRHGGVCTYATVVGADASLDQAPTVQFTTGDGRSVRTRSLLSLSVPTVPPGRVVSVFYNPRKPSRVAIPGHERNLLHIFLAIGVAFAALDVMLLVDPTGIPFFPMIIGAPYLGVGGYGIGRTWALRRRGIEADGVVVGETTSRNLYGVPLFHPIVRFRLPNGHEIQSVSERGHAKRRLPWGHAVRIRYDPTDPHRILLSGDGPRPIFAVFAAIGMVNLVIIPSVVA